MRRADKNLWRVTKKFLLCLPLWTAYIILVAARAESSYTYRAMVNYERGEFASALSDLERAHQIEPMNSEILFNLAILQKKNNQPDAAIRSYTSYIEMNPRMELAYFNRGMIKLSQNNFEGALSDFEKTLELESRFYAAQNNIAVIYFRQKKYAEALEAIRTAAEINTANEIVQANKTAIESCLK